MKAFLHETTEEGRELLGSGHAMVTGEYKSFATMYRYAIKPFLSSHNGRCKAEIFYNWDNRYGEADKVMTWNRDVLK